MSHATSSIFAVVAILGAAVAVGLLVGILLEPTDGDNL